jgi:hypothetical protein
MEVDEGLEPLGLPADDRERHGEVEHACAHRRLGRASDGDPDRKPVIQRRMHLVAGERATGLADVEKLRELLLEEPLVVAEVEPEQWKRLDERAAPDHDLRSSLGQQVANCWYSLIGTAEESTLTALVSRIRLVRAAIADSTTAGAEAAKSAR